MALSKDPKTPEQTEYDEQVRQTFNLSPDENTICFYCNDPVEHPAIFWMAHSGQIWFHPDCVVGFAVGLLSDVKELNRLKALRDDLGGRAEQ